jgi:hypothetical protein
MTRHYFFTVRGAGSFPFRLLFVDAAWPASAEQAEGIEMSCATVADEREITLCSADAPSPLRWVECRWPIQRQWS